MRLDSFKTVVGSTKNRKRIGRGHGSGHGKSAGRGDKGAGQRSGNKTRPVSYTHLTLPTSDLV